MFYAPFTYVPGLVKAGADRITFHVECGSDTEKTIDEILDAGVEAGLAVKPGTPIETVFPYLDKLSMVLVMTVEPGFGGQSFMAETMPKIETLRQKLQELGKDMDIQVDGGINAETISVAAKAGANVFVSGNALFSAEDMRARIAEFKSLAAV